MGRIVHRFIRDLTKSSAGVSLDLGKTGNCINYKLTREHVRYSIENNDRFKFLRKVIEEVPKVDLEAPNILQKEQFQNSKSEEHSYHKLSSSGNRRVLGSKVNRNQRDDNYQE